MRGELEPVRAETLARLEEILTKEQLDEFERMQEKVGASDEEENARELLANEEIFDTSET